MSEMKVTPHQFAPIGASTPKGKELSAQTLKTVVAAGSIFARISSGAATSSRFSAESPQGAEKAAQVAAPLTRPLRKKI